MTQLRVFDHISRQMQRLGFFKHLAKRVTTVSTSNTENLGNDLIEMATRRVNASLTNELATYVKIRLYDRVYTILKKQVDDWIKNGNPEPSPVLAVEIQDLYLADPLLPSGVGKLVKADYDVYPAFAINLGLLRAGTNSSTTRAASLLHFTSDQELKALVEFTPSINPLKLSQQQALLFLYSFLDSDGEVVSALWQELQKSEVFNDRNAGDLLPSIYRAAIARHRKRALSIDLRERLAALEKSADSIAKQADKIRYAGGTSREHASRPRLEPYVDIGIFTKPDRLKYEYGISQAGKVWLEKFGGERSSDEVENFLLNQFFTTAALALAITTRVLTTPNEIVPHLKSAWKAISISNGYAPIQEMALVAGIEALINDQLIIEIATARDALIAFQKANPYQVRFTVDRLGVLAHAKFMDDSNR
jgi:hypothetical protein